MEGNSPKRTLRLCKGIPLKQPYYKVQEASSFWYLNFCEFTIFYTIQVGSHKCHKLGKYLALTSGQGKSLYSNQGSQPWGTTKSLKGISEAIYSPWNSQIAPENGWLENDRFLLGRSIFRHCVSFRGCRWWFQPIWKICSSKWIISPGVKIKKNWTYPLNLLVDVQWLQVPKVFPLNSDSHVKGSILRITKVPGETLNHHQWYSKITLAPELTIYK